MHTLGWVQHMRVAVVAVCGVRCYWRGVKRGKSTCGVQQEERSQSTFGLGVGLPEYCPPPEYGARKLCMARATHALCIPDKLTDFTFFAHRLD